MTQITIDIFSDPVCPWCLVGLHRLNKSLAALPAEVAVKINHHPFLLDARTPPEGEDVEKMLWRKYGRDPAPMWDQLETEAKKSGLKLDMRKQKMRHPSQAAQALIGLAGNTGKQHEIAFTLSKACYLDAKNIADIELLVQIGVELGLEREPLLKALKDKQITQQIEKAALSASQQGISGVPFFIFNSKFALSGAQPEEVFSQALSDAMDQNE